ncbi:MAG: hypothetical protein RLZZ337_74 [Bacteroidota bacterium]|jgi:hypothetical protein
MYKQKRIYAFGIKQPIVQGQYYYYLRTKTDHSLVFCETTNDEITVDKWLRARKKIFNKYIPTQYMQYGNKAYGFSTSAIYSGSSLENIRPAQLFCPLHRKIQPKMKPVKCGGEIEITKGVYLNTIFPDFICSPSACIPEYRWIIRDVAMSVIDYGSGKFENYQFNNAGFYYISVFPKSGGQECTPCVIKVSVTQKDADTCKCGYYGIDRIRISGVPQYDLAGIKGVVCGDTKKLAKRKLYTFHAPLYLCDPADECSTTYRYVIKNAAGGIVASGINDSITHSFNAIGNYTISFTPICGGNECRSCEIKLSITN